MIRSVKGVDYIVVNAVNYDKLKTPKIDQYEWEHMPSVLGYQLPISGSDMQRGGGQAKV